MTTSIATYAARLDTDIRTAIETAAECGDALGLYADPENDGRFPVDAGDAIEAARYDSGLVYVVERAS